MKQETITVKTEEEKTRIDALLSARFEKISRSYIQYLIEEGFVLKDGAKVKKRDKLAQGTKISISFAPSEPLRLDPEPLDLDILYEDDYIIAINKKAGVVVHPGIGNKNGTLVAGVLHYLGTLPQTDDPLRPGIVHRLDKETSGVILVAKTREAHAGLVDSFKSRTIKKTYVAITQSRPITYKINAPIGRHPVRREMMTIRPTDGKEAITNLTVVAVGQKFAHVLAMPITGRTHQIRVHLKSIGTPIVGDSVYGNSKRGEEGLCLAAKEITFSHPITKEILTISAPLPDHIEQKLKNLD